MVVTRVMKTALLVIGRQYYFPHFTDKKTEAQR